MKNLISRVHDSIAEHNLIKSGAKIIIGLSGGPDSVFLAHALLPLHKQGVCTLIAAHLDHEWRADSHNDAQFCQKFAQLLGIQLITKKSSDLSLNVKFNGSQEEIGRTMRRHFFRTIKEQENADAIALGHHADDQQETFFIRLMRGTSLTGLIGMRPYADGYIRPLLTITKEEILAYLHTHSIAYVQDPTNTSENYLRNRLRKNVLPALKLADKRFDTNFSATLQRLHSAEQLLEKISQETFATVSFNDGNSLNMQAFLKLDPCLQQRILIHWFSRLRVPFPPSEAFLLEVMRFLKKGSSKTHQIHHTWHLEQDRQSIHIKKTNQSLETN